MKFLRTIRFDTTDEHAFNAAAAPDEWAISGAFAFAHLNDEEIIGKTKQEFANGFLGLQSFARSTFVTVGEITDEDYTTLEKHLAAHFIDEYGAPNLEAATEAAQEELTDAREICQEAPINTVFAVKRSINEDGEFNEAIYKVNLPTGERPHTQIWQVEDEHGAD